MDPVVHTCPTALFATIAIITGSLWGFWCRSFKFEGNSWSHEYLGTEYTITADDLHFSPWYQLKTSVSDVDCSSDGSCYVYTSNDCIKWGSDEDTKWNFSKVASAITVAIGGFLTFLVLLAACVGPVRKMWHVIAVAFVLICTLFQGLTFLIYRSNACDENPVRRELEDEINSKLETYLENAGITFNETVGLWDDDCSWDKGSSLNVVAIVFWFFFFFFMLVLGAPPSEDDEDNKAKPAEQPATQAEEENNSEPDIAVGASAAGASGNGTISINA